MSNLIKIKDMSSQYGISARTLRYYEDMGLIASTRTDDYAYRLYDETAVKKLEQILILRKLNINIKDIQRIFNSLGSEIVLDVLGKKVDDIDSEVSLLHELKQIILSFIRHIEKVDFNKESDVKKLYDKAREIEEQIVNVEYEGNQSNFKRLLEINDKLNQRHQNVMIINLPKCKAITSGWQWWDDLFVENGFSQWIWANRQLHKEAFFNTAVYCVNRTVDFHGSMACMNIIVHDDVTKNDANPYELIEFEGGLYAYMSGSESDGEYCDAMYHNILKWLKGTGFEYDETRYFVTQSPGEGHEEIKKGLGYLQFQRYVPIKMIAENKISTTSPNKYCGTEVIKKFFTAFHKKFGANLERRFTDFDFDRCEKNSAHISYMVERDVKPGVSVVFEVNADEHDPCIFVGFGMVKSEEQTYFGDKEIVNDLREHYGIVEKKSSDWMICFDYLMFEGEEIKLINSDGGYGNYLKLFDAEKFDKIVDSAVEQARNHFTKIKPNLYVR